MNTENIRRFTTIVLQVLHEADRDKAQGIEYPEWYQELSAAYCALINGAETPSPAEALYLQVDSLLLQNEALTAQLQDKNVELLVHKDANRAMSALLARALQDRKEDVICGSAPVVPKIPVFSE